MKYNVEILFKTRSCFPPPPYNFILFKLDFDVKFPLLRLLLFLSDLKTTIVFGFKYLKGKFINNDYKKRIPELWVNIVKIWNRTGIFFVIWV